MQRYLRVSFWGLNLGLAGMVVLNLFPSGVLQLLDATKHGYWHARSAEFSSQPLIVALEWARLPADVVFILFGVVPLVIVTLLTYRHARVTRAVGFQPIKVKRVPVMHIVLTIRHSTRSIDEFLGLMKAHGIETVVDVRTVPRSRHNPQFNRDTLPASLKAIGIDYVHMAGLGGLRHARKDSQNMGWRNASFRGFADYMQTEEFKASLQELIELSKTTRIAIMCAEAVPWRCHRSLIADALLCVVYEIGHIIGPAPRLQEHRLTPFARREGRQHYLSRTVGVTCASKDLSISSNSSGVRTFSPSGKIISSSRCICFRSSFM